MKTKWIILTAVLQVMVLVFMAGEREWVLRTGRTLYLRTVPVDPRDAMRGDYVSLSYDISRVPRDLWRGRLAGTDLSMLPADTVVYAALNLSDNLVAELVGLDLDPPLSGCFIRGRMERQWWRGNNNMINVRYGIEAFFTQQGRAEEIERNRRQGSLQIPLEMEVAIGSGGMAVLKGYRKCDLGIKLDLEVPHANTHGKTKRSTGAVISLVNLSSNSLAVIDSLQALALLPDTTQWNENVKWNWKSTPVRDPLRVVLLPPGQTHQIKISFSDPFWSVFKTENGKSEPPTILTNITNDWMARFRFEYRPPDKQQCANLTNSTQIWHGKLTSPVFSPPSAEN